MRIRTPRTKMARIGISPDVRLGGRRGGRTDGWGRRIDARPMKSKMGTRRVETMTKAGGDCDEDNECGEDDGGYRGGRTA